MTFYSLVHVQNVAVGESPGQFLLLQKTSERKNKQEMENYPTDTECGNNPRS